MTTKTILVTGGTGFIGAALVRRLVLEGHRVRVLDDDSRGSSARLADIRDDFEFYGADVRDPAAVSKAAKGADAIWHLAYVNGTEFFYSKPEVVLDVGIKGMVNVLDACREHGIGEMVLASSSEVYQTPPNCPTDEAVPLIVPDIMNPRYSYGGGKIACELMAINYGRQNFDRVMIFRPHNVYGPDMGWEHVLPQFVLRMKRQIADGAGQTVEFPIQGDGQETRAFVFIDDFIDGLMAMDAKGQHLNIYHVGTQEEVSVRDVAAQVARYFGRDLKIIPGPLQPGGTPRRCPDIAKLRALGYSPKIGLAEGVPILAKWYDENAHLAPKKKEV